MQKAILFSPHWQWFGRVGDESSPRMEILVLTLEVALLEAD
jgi:hypothetical protein